MLGGEFGGGVSGGKGFMSLSFETTCGGEASSAAVVEDTVAVSSSDLGLGTSD